MRTIRIIFTTLFLFLISGITFADNVNTHALLTDTRVVYVYDHSNQIDWALIYYLTSENGCQVDLATVKSGPVYKKISLESKLYNISLSKFYIPEILYNYLDSAARELYLKNLPDTALEHLDSAGRELYKNYLPDSSVEYLISLARELYGEQLPEETVNYFDTVGADLFGENLPDIMIFSSDFKNRELQAFKNYLLDIPEEKTDVFFIRKYFCRVDKGNTKSVYLNAEQYFLEHSREIEKMAAAVAETTPLPALLSTYTIYDPLIDRTESSGELDFLSGIEKLKFDLMAEKYIPSASGRKAYEPSRNKYISHLESALHQTGLNKIESLMSALGEIQKIRQTYYYQIGKHDTLAPMAEYIENATVSLSSAIFQEADIDYRAKIEIRDTPEGKRLKFKSEINNNGYLDIEAGWLEIETPDTDSAKILDDTWANIKPNNSLVRAYTIDVDPNNPDAIDADMVRFVGRVKYGGEEVGFVYTANAYEESPLSVEFVPDFMMIKPFGKKIKIDRLVEQADLKALIRKPADYVGRIKIKVVSPNGVMTGAYRDEIELKNGQRAVEIDIPMVMTHSAGTDKKQVEIDLIKGGNVIASDHAGIRQAEFNIPSNVNIALFPDQNGLLEDVLIETDALYRPVSERFLVAGNFDLYDAVIFGSHCFRNYNSLDIIKDKIKEYMEYGGTVIVFGQPDEWRDDMLPISIISTTAGLSSDSLQIMDKKHPIFSAKYKIDTDRLINAVNDGYISYPAVVFPGEKIIKSSSNTTVLAQTKLGKGKFIYCGLPLLEMIRDLNIDAIKLYSNLIHYSGK